MKIINNILQSILLFITIVITLISFTLLNDRFILHNFEKNNYYETLYKEAKNISYKEFKSDTQKYIKSHYKTNYHINSLSKYLNKYNIKKYTYIIYIINILLIIITGCIFINKKKKHNIKFILVLSSILIILLYGYIKIFVSFDNNIINEIVNNYNKYNLFYAVIVLDYLIVNKIFNKCK